MKKIAILILALGLLTGCTALTDLISKSDTSVQQQAPQRMVQLELTQQPNDPAVEPRTILFTTSGGLFSQQIVDEAESPEIGAPRTVIQINGRVFEIEPDFVRLNVVMRIQAIGGRMLTFDRTVTPIPGQKLLLHDDGTQTITLLAWVIPGANDPQREAIEEKSPPSNYGYQERQPIVPAKPNGAIRPTAPTTPSGTPEGTGETKPGEATPPAVTPQPVNPPMPQPGEGTIPSEEPKPGEVTPPAAGTQPPTATETVPQPGGEPAPVVPTPPFAPSPPTAPATP